MADNLLRWKQVKERVPVSKSKWYDGVAKGIFPQPVRHLGPRTAAWKESEIVGVMEMRRHYTNYFRGIPHFKEYRMKMVTSDSAQEVFAVFDEVLQNFA